MPYPLDVVALEFECNYCLAQPGRWCRRRSRTTGDYTGRASWLHVERTRPVREAWRIGWAEGVAQVVDDLDRWADAVGSDPKVPADLMAADLRWAAARIRDSWVARRD